MNRSSMALRLQENQIMILDQTKLPGEELWIHANSPEKTAELIYRLAIRGAPLIGVSAALSLGLYALQNSQSDEIYRAAKILTDSRPTAVNLRNCIDLCLKAYEASNKNSEAVLKEALRLFDEDVNCCQKIGMNGSRFIQDGDNILTHCNTGGLATVGKGTALSIIITAWESGKKIHVYVDETRPLLQGSRLTAYELQKNKIPFTIICDSMAGSLMAQRKIQKVFTGADRIAVNGDSANKIGTYSLAVLSKYHKIPFFIAAPRSTYDPNCKTGKEIPIELRSEHEITSILNQKNLPAFNPSFDVTPHELITALIFDDEIRSLN